MKQLNFRRFHTNSKKFFETVYFSQKEAKTAPKRPILFFLVYQGVFGHFTTKYLFEIPKGYRTFPKTAEDSRRPTKRSNHCQRCPKNPPSETENIIKLANLTANTKNFYGQITLNTKPHSDPLFTYMSEKVWKQLV